MILHLHEFDGLQIWINSKLIEAFGPSMTRGHTWIRIRGKEYLVTEDSDKILTKILQEEE